MRQVIPFSKDIVFKTNIASITSISLEHEEKIKDGEVNGDFIILGDYKIHNDTTEKELFKYRLPFTTLIPDNIETSSVSIDIDNFTYETIEDDVLKVNIDFCIMGEEKEEPEDKREEVEEIERVEILNEEDIELVEEHESEGAEENEIMVPENIDEIYEAIDDFMEKQNLNNRETNEDSEENLDRKSEYVEQMNEEVEQKLETLQNQIEKEKEEENREPEISMINTVQKQDNVEEEEQSIQMNQMVQKEVSEYVTYHIHIVKSDETLDGILKNYGSNMDIIKDYNDVTNIGVGDKVIIPEYLDE